MLLLFSKEMFLLVVLQEDKSKVLLLFYLLCFFLHDGGDFELGAFIRVGHVEGKTTRLGHRLAVFGLQSKSTLSHLFGVPR